MSDFRMPITDVEIKAMNLKMNNRLTALVWIEKHGVNWAVRALQGKVWNKEAYLASYGFPEA